MSALSRANGTVIGRRDIARILEDGFSKTWKKKETLE
jgi:hypothetical protein